MTVIEALIWATKKLKPSASPLLDAEVLLCSTKKSTKEDLYARPYQTLTKIQIRNFRKAVNKRSAGYPIAYLTGHKEFRSLEFFIRPGVLIPRPETETLVETALNYIKDKKPDCIIDVGTGSGVIILSLADELRRSYPQLFSQIRLLAIEPSVRAAAVFKINAKKFRLNNKVGLSRSSLLSKNRPNGKTLILANLPYLTRTQIRRNPQLRYEPSKALDGGKNGLALYQELFPQIEKGQMDIRAVILEHDPAQKARLQKLAAEYFQKAKIEFEKDLFGRYRVMKIRFK